MRRLAAPANRMARVVVQGPDAAHPETYRARFEQALAEKERLEHELAALAHGATGSTDGEASVNGVASALPDGTGLVAFVQFSRAQGDDYGVLLMRKDDPGPRLIDLGR